MKGGTRILVYEITVFLGSVPFIIFLTWRARVWGLNTKCVFFITVYLCVDVMLFAWALRLGWIYWWILSVIVLFMSSILWLKILINKTKDNVSSSKINVDVESDSQELIEPTQMSVIEPESPVNREEKVCLLSIDELLDLGFQEKQAENLEKAASYFSQVLSKDLLPDLAFSLIIECYWLWNNLGERDFANTQLQTHIKKYYPLFNTELRLQFETWKVKQDLQI